MSPIQQEAVDLRAELIGLMKNLNATFSPKTDQEHASLAKVISSGAIYEVFLNIMVKDQVKSRFQTEFTDYKFREVFKPIQDFILDVETFLNEERLKSA